MSSQTNVMEREQDPAADDGLSPTDIRLQVTDFAPDDDVWNFETFPQRPSIWRHPIGVLLWLGSLLLAWVSLILLLAVLAAIPLANFLVLGYLLAAQGRVARTGKLTYAGPWLVVASRIGSIAVGTWFCLLLISTVAAAATDAALIAPGSQVASNWDIARRIVAVVLGVHLLAAVARGGNLGAFFRPIRNLRWVSRELWSGRYWTQASAICREFLMALRLPEHFWLGVSGYLGTFLWLLLPTVLFAALRDITKPGQILVTLIGGACLIPVLAWTPFLQAHYAAEGRISAFKELRTVRRLFTRAPLTWTLTTIALYLLALPLYLLKIAAPPQDAMWFVTLIFIATIYPAKMLIGWAYGIARRRENAASAWWCWPCRLILVPLLAIYLFLVFFTPAIGAAGRRVLFEHHALLLPTPF